MIPKILTGLLGLFCGGWMLFDGVHVILRGKYFGPEKPGPWSIPFVKLGIDPFSLGPLFIVFGILWLVFLVGTLAGQSWGWFGAVAVAVATLWYAPLGTVLSLIYLTLLWMIRSP